MDAIPEDTTELTMRLAVLALEESGRPRAARVLRRWTEELLAEPVELNWDPPDWAPIPQHLRETAA